MPRKNVLLFALVVLGFVLALQLNMIAARRSDYSVFDPLVDVCDLVRRNYVSETNDEELVQGAINGMLHKLDPYSEYVPPQGVEEFQKRTSGTYEGIGIGIDIEQGRLTVISPFEGFPAQKAGVRSGDIILQVNDQATKGWSSTRAVQKMTGPAGTKVTLKVLHRDGTEQEILITREKIQVPTVRGWRRNTVDGAWDYMLDDQAGIGYVRLTQFNSDTTGHFQQAVETLRGLQMKAMILDLRSNPGGLMSAAVEIIDRFIDHGLIVSTRGAHTQEQTQKAQAEGTYPRFHLVVMIDQGSASASEIVAGSLQDHGRAVIVGQRSWGKGSVQRIIHLPDTGAALKLTTDYYYLPKGRCVHRLPDAEQWGVQPDIEEEFDTDNIDELRQAIDDLTIETLARVEERTAQQGHRPADPCALAPAPDDPAPTEDAPGTDPADQALKIQQAQRLTDLDSQLAQAVKQCRGLLRARPSLQGLAESITE